MTTKDLVRVAIMVTMIAIGAFIRIPAPVIGSFTLQLPFVILTGIVLGSKKGALAATVYCIGGLLGIPWFTMGGGLGYIFQPTFGFIISFIFGAFIVGYFRELSMKTNPKKGLIMTIIGSILTTLVVWIFGMLYLSAIYQYYLGNKFGYLAALASIFSPSLVADLITAVLIPFVGLRIHKAIRR
ncbi:MAG: ECF transporter S component [Peptostreptococcales bacterium]